jgi:hypothetical protein
MPGRIQFNRNIILISIKLYIRIDLILVKNLFIDRIMLIF